MDNHNSVYLMKEGSIGTIVINNPPVNALNNKVMTGISEAINEVKESADIKSVIITGHGDRAFVAGADIKEFTSLDEASSKNLIERGQHIFDQLEDLPKPVICSIFGVALGAGCELALACDIRIAEESAKIGLPELNLGIIPGYGGTQRLSRLVGTGKAKEIIFLGEAISAKEAYQIGFVEKVVPHGEGLSAAREMAQKFAVKPPLALAKAKQAISFGNELSLKNGLKLEAQLCSELYGTEDKDEGVQAFFEKRKPNFRGR